MDPAPTAAQPTPLPSKPLQLTWGYGGILLCERHAIRPEDRASQAAQADILEDDSWHCDACAFERVSSEGGEEEANEWLASQGLIWSDGGDARRPMMRMSGGLVVQVRE